VPYDKRLAKKKKFQTPRQLDVVLNNARIIETRQETDQYMELCRSNDLRPESVTSKLYCKYESKGKPYYIYGPQKVEVVSLEPHIVVLHNFIMDGESKAIIASAAPRLKRSQVSRKK
jgi:hypothetical protein